jgi:hypothetical protein
LKKKLDGSNALSEVAREREKYHSEKKRRSTVQKEEGSSRNGRP